MADLTGFFMADHLSSMMVHRTEATMARQMEFRRLITWAPRRHHRRCIGRDYRSESQMADLTGLLMAHHLGSTTAGWMEAQMELW
jgi:hypothetical protein